MQKTNLSEWLAIEMVRSAESGAPLESAGVFDDLPSARRDAQGRLLDSERYLADRAARALPLLTGWTQPRLHGALGFLFGSLTLIALLLGAVVSPLSCADRLLGSSIVNLAGPYFFFLLMQILFLALALIFLPWTLLCFLGSFFRRKKALRTQHRAAALGVGFLGVAVIWTVRWLAEGICRFVEWLRSLGGRKRAVSRSSNFAADRQTAADRQKMIEAADRFFDRLFEHTRTFFFFAGMLSHLFWFALSGVVLLILLTRMQANLYDYCWNSSLGDRHQVETLIRWAGEPIRFFAPVPNRQDIDWLFENSASYRAALAPAADNAAATAAAPHVAANTSSDCAVSVCDASIRKKWSWFLLSVVLFYAVLPRLVLAMIYYGLFCCSLKDFRPDFSEPYYVDLIDRVEGYSTRTAASVIDDGQAAELGVPKLEKPSGAAENPNLPPLAPPSETLVLGCDAEMSESRWREIFGREEKIVFFGNIFRSRETQRRFGDQIALLTSRVARTVVLTDVGLPPSRQTRLFFQNKLFALLPYSACYLILSCGERLRQKYSADPSAVAQRVDDWREVLRQMSETLGRAVEPILFYDHELNLDEPRCRLAAYFGAPIEPPNDSNGRPDRFGEAEKMILERSPRLFQLKEDEAFDRLQTELTAGYNDLLKIYRDESRTLWDRASEAFRRKFSDTSPSDLAVGGESSNEGWTKRLTDSIPTDTFRRLSIRPEDFAERLVPALATAQKMSQLCHKLSPKSAIAFGALGASLPILALAGPALTGAAGVGALAAGLSTLLPSSLTAGAFGAAIGSMIPAGFEAMKERARGLFERNKIEPNQDGAVVSAAAAFVRMMAAWAAVFELQCFSEEVIADELARLTAPLDELSLETSEEIHSALESFAVDLRHTIQAERSTVF